MNKEPNKEINKEVSKEADVTTMSGCLITVFSKLLGPVFLIICAVIIAAHRTAFPSTVDIVYGVLLMLVVIARLIDRPPMPADKNAEAAHSPVIKYSIIIFVSGIALWFVARLILSQLL